MSIGRARCLESGLFECSAVIIPQRTGSEEETFKLVQQGHLMGQRPYWRAPRDRFAICPSIHRQRFLQQLELLASKYEAKDQLMFLANRLISVPATHLDKRFLLP